ncbi:MAG: hypothetical protein M3N68_08075, partial [Actinomycetota bacterium]|nr:hypothetical protein [Actinomycetota bacterium]
MGSEKRPTSPDKRLYGLVALAAFMGLGHHVDHVVRGNHVGWPVDGEVNAFTYSLAIYPMILLGLFLYHSHRVGPGFWVFLSGAGALFVGVIHFGPTAVEPPGDIINLYEPRLIGWLAFAWLVAFLAVLVVASVYEARLWIGHRRAGPQHRDVG